MNLKEAFRYQNKLQAFLEEAHSTLDRDSNVTRVENTYLRHKVNAEAEDETVVTIPDTEYYEQITDLTKFMLYLLDEKAVLSAAIRKANGALDIDMDGEVSLNASRQRAARTLQHMNTLRSSEQILSNGGVGYRFNAEGNQVSYAVFVTPRTVLSLLCGIPERSRRPRSVWPDTCPWNNRPCPPFRTRILRRDSIKYLEDSRHASRDSEG